MSTESRTRGEPPACCGFSETVIGWTVGAGADYALNDSWSLGIEYRYTDFGDETEGLPPAFPGVNMTVNTETHAVHGRINFHFKTSLPFPGG